MFDKNITKWEKNKRHPQSVVHLKFKNFCPLCFCLTKTFFLWPNKVTIFVPKSSNLFSPRKTVGTMYIRLQAYVYIYQCIYIYIHARRVSIRFVLYACHSNHAGSSPHGGFFTFLCQFLQKSKTQIVPHLTSFKKNMLQK